MTTVERQAGFAHGGTAVPAGGNTPGTSPQPPNRAKISMGNAQCTTGPGFLGFQGTVPPSTSPASQTPPSPPVQQAADTAEAKAKNSLTDFLAAKAAGAANLINVQNQAIHDANDNLAAQQKLIPQDVAKVQDAYSMLRQALDTKQGQAEAGQKDVAKKIGELFVKEQSLEGRAKPDSHAPPLTEKEIDEINKIITEAEEVANQNELDWGRALNANDDGHTEPYGDYRTCENGFEGAQKTKELVARISEHAELYVKELDDQVQ